MGQEDGVDEIFKRRVEKFKKKSAMCEELCEHGENKDGE